VFSGAYILPAATEPGQERSCTIPAGLPILASPAGSIAWAPTDGSTPEELSAARDAGLAGLTARRATLDGASLPLQLVKNFVHPLKLQPGNLVQTVDPNVKGTSTLVATGTWLTWIRDLAPGHHTVVLSDKINGASADITLHLTVQSPAEDLSVKGSYTGTGGLSSTCSTAIGVDAQGSGDWTALQPTTFTLHFCNADSTGTITEGRFTITTAEGTMAGDLTGEIQAFGPGPEFPFQFVMHIGSEPGTGRFAGATGELSLQGAFGAGAETFHGSVDGTLHTPTAAAQQQA
jgi:hypothetical protein